MVKWSPVIASCHHHFPIEIFSIIEQNLPVNYKAKMTLHNKGAC